MASVTRFMQPLTGLDGLDDAPSACPTFITDDDGLSVHGDELCKTPLGELVLSDFLSIPIRVTAFEPKGETDLDCLAHANVIFYSYLLSLDVM